MKDLSILIPARSEMFLKNTIDDILANIEADTEVIVTLDGEWAEPNIPQNDRVNVIYVPESIGQRAAQNIACRLSKAKFVMKADAHVAFDKGFDRKMIEAFKEDENVTMLPVMRNLWAFDWKCYHCGKRYYQANVPKVCECGRADKFRRKMVWIAKERPCSTSYCFDSTPQFKYFNEYTKRPEYIKDKAEKGLTETMSISGSCFMSTRENYWKKKLCDESLGNWGNQGIEVACKTWLSGGRVLTNHNTWYAHLFRTNDVLKFPWPVSGSDQERVKKNVRDFIWGGKYDKAIHPVSWLVERFWPVKGWSDEDLRKLKESETRPKV